MRKEGFTLIELIIVIVILGILAAVAVPKFAGLTKDAKISAVKGFAGSVRAAANIVHGKWLAQCNVEDNCSDNVSLEGRTVMVDNNTSSGSVAPGYPLANTNGIVQAVDFDNKTFVPNENADNVTFGYDNKTGCSVTYVYATSYNNTTSSAPTVTIDTSGCK